jgi:threonine synthase
MKIEDFPTEIRGHIIPRVGGEITYQCLVCKKEFPIHQLLYTCPDCQNLLMIIDKDPHRLREISGETWQRIFDYRKMANIPSLKGVFLYHEFIAPVIPLDQVIYLGEGHTSLVPSNDFMENLAGMEFYFKNDGQNPSASFKDRGMASALSYINYLVRTRGVKDILAICASTGDTSASAALYASYLHESVRSAVLVPYGKITKVQLAQPLGSGAHVFEIPGVFDDCMKVVENLADNYNVALLNSKNAWRIRGQESYAFEIAQDLDYDTNEKVVVVPIGNAGNITAIMSGFLRLHEAGIIKALPKIIGVQSVHANPVYRYYLESDLNKRVFSPVTVRPSVAQAAMIGNPVSMPRVIKLVEEYEKRAGGEKCFVVEVTEQEIMDCQLIANRNGHFACTQGGESLAGLLRAFENKIVRKDEVAILDSTAHALKFYSFQEMYFNNSFPPDFEIVPRNDLQNHPRLIKPEGLKKLPESGKRLSKEEFQEFVKQTSAEIATILRLEKR